MDLSDWMMQYNANLMFGNPKADLSGQCKDDVPMLVESFNDMEKQLQDGPPTHAFPTTGPSFLVAERLQSYLQRPLIEHEPVTELPIGRPLIIRAHVTSDAGIKWVRLRCRSLNQRLDYDTIPMTPTGNPDEYQAIVPAEKISPRFDFMYYIEAMDNHGQGCIYPNFEERTPYVVVKLER